MSTAPTVYIAAAVAYAMWQDLHNDNKDWFSYPQTEDQFCDWFSQRYNGRIDRNEASRAIAVLAEIGFLSYDEDVFAGRFITADGQTFSQRWREVIRSAPDSPFAKAYEFGDTWLSAVFDNVEFWNQFRADEGDDVAAQLPSSLLPTSEPLVFIIESSPDGIALAEGLDRIADELRTSNEVASHLGDDRPRILAEVNASRDLLKAGTVRKSAVRELLVKVLRELASKLKDKAMDWGIDKLLEIALRLLGAS